MHLDVICEHLRKVNESFVKIFNSKCKPKMYSDKKELQILLFVGKVYNIYVKFFVGGGGVS